MSSESQETRERILQAAAAVLRDQQQFRMADVAAEAGVSRQAVYLHFDGRAELLIEVARYIDRVEGLAELAEGIWRAESAAEALDRFISLQVEYNPKIYPFVAEGLRGRYEDEAIKAAWEDRMASRRKACRKLVLWLKREQLLGAGWGVEGATDMLWALTSIQMWEALVVETGWSPERYVSHLRRTLQRGLLAD